jgi:hypothetical protein
LYVRKYWQWHHTELLLSHTRNIWLHGNILRRRLRVIHAPSVSLNTKNLFLECRFSVCTYVLAINAWIVARVLSLCWKRIHRRLVEGEAHYPTSQNMGPSYELQSTQWRLSG